ncbi:MAG: WD40 repeat domain-containing protein [Opitutales bacterium]
MKKFLLKTILFISSTTPLFSFASGKILVSGQGWNDIAIIDKDSSKIEWSASLDFKNKGMNCSAMTNDGNVAVACGTAAAIIDRNTKKVIWKYDTKKDEEIHNITPLENGNYLLGACGNPARIFEVDKDKNILNEVNFDTDCPKVHSQFRHVTIAKNGNFLVALLQNKKILEIDKAGKTVSSYDLSKMPGGVFGVIELKDGNLLASSDKGEILVLDRKSQEVLRQINNENLKGGSKLLFACKVVELDNGNLLVANWAGHSKDKTQAKVLEIDKDNNVVWTLDNKTVKNAACIQLGEF